MYLEKQITINCGKLEINLPRLPRNSWVNEKCKVLHLSICSICQLRTDSIDIHWLNVIGGQATKEHTMLHIRIRRK